VVLVKSYVRFSDQTTPSARLWSLRGVLNSRSLPSSAEEGSRAHPNVLLIFGQLCSRGGEPRHQEETGEATFDGADGVVLVKRYVRFPVCAVPEQNL